MFTFSLQSADDTSQEANIDKQTDSDVREVNTSMEEFKDYISLKDNKT